MIGTSRTEARTDMQQDPKDPRASGMVAMVALLVMFGLVAVMVWVGG